MKKTLLTVAVTALMATTLSARAETALPANTFIAAEAPVQYLAKDRLIGIKVKGPDGKIIGDIEDIILSGDHQVVGVVMGTGGFFGMFEKKVGVEMSAIQFDVVDGKIGATLPSATSEVVAAAPAFERNQPKKSLFERAVEKSQEIRDKTGASAKDAYESAKDKAGPAMEKAKETAKEALEKAKDAATDAVEKAKGAASDAVEKAKDAAKPAPEAPKP
ncbi:MAG: PRC-barrel domain-containing protein [Hyphomicrobium sp.]